MNEIDKNNKLIAEFMGLEVKNGDSIYVQNNMFGRGTGTLNRIRYHSSWDWLMPVVRKINYDIDFPTADRYHSYIGKPSYHEGIYALNDYFNSLCDNLCDVDIEKSYECVCSFIKLYNELKEEEII